MFAANIVILIYLIFFSIKARNVGGAEFFVKDLVPFIQTKTVKSEGVNDKIALNSIQCSAALAATILNINELPKSQRLKTNLVAATFTEKSVV